MNKIHFFTCLAFITLLNSCDAERDFLDAKPNQSLVVPSTLSDYERLLNDQFLFNMYTDISLGTAASDEYYITTQSYNSLDDHLRLQYIWAQDIEEGNSLTYANEWNDAYERIFVCNVVLEGLESLSDSQKSDSQFNTIKGRALFLRSWTFYDLVQTYAMPYNPSSAQNDLGIPLRISSDINARSARASIQNCYDQIIEDLIVAYGLLPEKSPYKTHPAAVATLGFLARVHLAMGNYEKAFEYANSFLSKYNTLTDYNTLSAGLLFAINSTFLDEDVFHVSINSDSPSTRSRVRVPQSFYDLYNTNDLRKSLFFRFNASGQILYKGSYNYWGDHYSGIATDEIYLIRAECYARDGKTELALADLNHLLGFRWNKNEIFSPIVVDSSKEALKIVLEERRKELLFRGTRWTDLRRLNQEPEFHLTLSREIGGQQYFLPPNDKRYALPIPKAEIELSGIEQNIR